MTTYLHPIDPNVTYWCLDCGLAIDLHPPARALGEVDPSYCEEARKGGERMRGVKVWLVTAVEVDATYTAGVFTDEQQAVELAERLRPVYPGYFYAVDELELDALTDWSVEALDG